MLQLVIATLRETGNTTEMRTAHIKSVEFKGNSFFSAPLFYVDSISTLCWDEYGHKSVRQTCYFR